ncbi:unnamed protein product [Orchesella dallaii]|uniref:C2H2-type domain-containing protein n=1 Tax=Orchesella dallaii TaxID=48710 RepID=A0ABP1RCE2_9HEXA
MSPFRDAGPGSDSSTSSCDSNTDLTTFSSTTSSSPSGLLVPFSSSCNGSVDTDVGCLLPNDSKSVQCSNAEDTEGISLEVCKTATYQQLENWLKDVIEKHPFNDVVKAIYSIKEDMGLLSKHVQNLSPPWSDYGTSPQSQGAVLQTPQKHPVQHLVLHDAITPPSYTINEQRHQPSKEPSITSTSLILRRSLLGPNPNSLEDVLASTNINGGKYRDAIVQTETRSMYTPSPQHQPPSPSLQLINGSGVSIKPDPDDSFHQNSDGKPKLLSLLADAAFALGGQTKSSLTTEILPDSGRSSEQSSFIGSPGPAEYDASKSASKSMYRIVKGSPSDTKLKIILPRPSSPESSASGNDENQPETETKSVGRKRRKNKQPLPCNHCGKLFNNQSSLRQHESFHLPDRPFQCKNEKCDKAYKTRSELNRHLVVHSGEKKHICVVCKKRFLRKQYLKTHVLRHHETGLTMMASPNTSSLQRSLMSAARSEFSNHAEPLTWRCNLCLKIFIHVDDLAKHVRSYHEKKRQFMAQEKAVGNCGISSMEIVPHVPAQPLSSSA